jgi:N-acetylglucosaminylphosphatidylinositol deacetylase
MTFDKNGVSSHPNHIAVHHGVALVFGEAQFPFDVISLTTVGIVRKYIAFADIQNCMPH